MQILKSPEAPLIHFSQRNEIVDRLIQIIGIHEHNDREYRQEIDRLKGIVAQLQKAPKKPIIQAAVSQEKKKKKKKKRGKGLEQPKASRLPIQKEEIVRVDSVPEGSVFKGYQ